jgi:hypothetical protein
MAGTGLERLRRFWAGDNGLTFLSAVLLLLIFVVLPLQSASFGDEIGFDVTLTFLMISGAVAVHRSRFWRWATITFAVAAIALRWASSLSHIESLMLASALVNCAAVLLFARTTLMVVFYGGAVTLSRVQGGVAAYLLLGIAWAFAYQAIVLGNPHALHFPQPSDAQNLSQTLIYFSFITMTTLGYGDIFPISPLARAVVTGEALVGQLFPAIFIAAMVSLAMRQQTRLTAPPPAGAPPAQPPADAPARPPTAS